ncbi:patatin-like protein [Nocardia sp. CWNU-33]|uniref:patatin-like protein n=1 Tax=Nocardia sp. CWNU-33 TaxID=3392117 RepID=UPI00398EA04A
MNEPAELRIALVCYGGVSLAIYMHGITKELHKLVRASRALDNILDSEPDAPNPFDNQSDTEAVYFDALRDMAREGRRLSVNIDIIGGTSAGGINGIVLSKAIAQNASQDDLKRLWIDHADLRALVRAPSIGGTVTRTFFAALFKLATFWTRRAPLNGDLMSRLLYQALTGMDQPTSSGAAGNAVGPVADTLIPDGGALSLFVTTTDLNGFDVAIRSPDGTVGQRELCHAQVLEFIQENGNKPIFGKQATPTLAFAARATSAFPGAFDPVNVLTFPREAEFPPNVEVDTDRFRFNYAENGVDAEEAWFVDGGVLDNAPFDLVIDAISRRQASTEVYRRLVYIEPDPGCALEAPPTDTNSGRAAKRRWGRDLFHVLNGIKGSQSILDDLIDLRAMNEKIAEVGAIAEQQRVEVLDRIRYAHQKWRGDNAIASKTVSNNIEEAIAAIPVEVLEDQDAFLATSRTMHQEAAEALGSTYNTYQRLKAASIARCVATAIVKHFALPLESSTAVFIRSCTLSWVRRQPFWENPDPEESSKSLSEFLQPIDIPYRHRRMQFILAGLNKLYTVENEPLRASINQLKALAWEHIDAILAGPVAAISALDTQGALEFLRPQKLPGGTASSNIRPDSFVASNLDNFDMLFDQYTKQIHETQGGGGDALWQAFAALRPQWDKRHLMLLASRYLGFPLWDGLLFPTIALSNLPQFTQIPITQFSPLRAKALTPLNTRKLEGFGYHHFRAFFKPKYRENDYLWGRLDATELILRSLDETVPGASAPATAHLPDALNAILDAESDLKQIPPQLIRHLRDQINGLNTDDGTDTGPG